MIIFLILTIVLHANGQDQGHTPTVLPPIITGSPLPDGSSSKYFASENSVTLRCNATGSPKPEITWYKRGFIGEEVEGSGEETDSGEEVVDAHLSNIWVLLDDSLKIEPMTALDEGTYFCKARTEIDDILLGEAISIDVKLTKAVLGRYPPIAVENYLVNEGDFLMLPCIDVKSIPRAEFSWAIVESEDDESSQPLTLNKRMNIDIQGNFKYSQENM